MALTISPDGLSEARDFPGQDWRYQAAGIPAGKDVTIVIGIRANEERPDYLKRLAFLKEDPQRPDNIGVIVVDDGSPQRDAQAIQSICAQEGYGYVYLETSHRLFANARCRNVGASVAQSPYLFFMDVDLIPYPGFFNALLVEMDRQAIAVDEKRFLMVGNLFLTKIGTQTFFRLPPETRHTRYLQALQCNSHADIAKFSTGTPSCIYHRHYYLARGGNAMTFEGWGAEDMELVARTAWLDDQFPTPTQWQRSTGNFVTKTTYRGWRSQYRLYGDSSFQSGLILFHAWHETPPAAPYRQRQTANMKQLNARLKAFCQSGQEPPVLPDLNLGRTVLLGTPREALSRRAQVSLGEIVSNSDISETDVTDWSDWIQQNAVQRVAYLDDTPSSLVRKLVQLSITCIQLTTLDIATPWISTRTKTTRHGFDSPLLDGFQDVRFKKKLKALWTKCFPLLKP